MEGKFRWAIVGIGMISEDFVNALSIAPSAHTVEAVASRSQERAEEFARRHNIPHAYGSYEALTSNNNIDCVYIGTHTPYHCELSCLFMEAGFNVLCEKPFAMDSGQVQLMLDTARKNNVFLSEGHWTRYFPAMKELRARLPELGRIHIADITMCLDIRQQLMQDTTGTRGAFADMSSYAAHLANIIFQEEPLYVNACGLLTEQGIQEYNSVTLVYRDGRICRFMTYSNLFTESEAIVYGEKGTLRMPYNWSPVEITVNGETQKFPLPETDRSFIYPRSQCFLYEADACRNYIMQGLKESPVIPLADSLQTVQLLERIDKERRVFTIKNSQ